jgi:indolepyruvate ferredoxin oxidoreductase beta subunit
MKAFNIYLTGVGGQGIGLLSEIILRAADHASLRVKGVDTHGLAQRGGVVISQIRIGDRVNSPLIQPGHADLVVALERHEALRGTIGYLRNGGTLIYYDVAWQPLDVRLGSDQEVTESDVREFCEQQDIRVYKVFETDLPDARMQNVALLARITKLNLIPDVTTDHYLQAMDDLMTGKMLEKNLELFHHLSKRD